MTKLKRRHQPYPVRSGYMHGESWSSRRKAKCSTEADVDGLPTMETERVEILHTLEDDFLDRGVATLVKDIALYWAVYGARHLELPSFPALPITHNQIVTSRTTLLDSPFEFSMHYGIASRVIDTGSWYSSHFHPSLEIRWHATGGSVL